MQSQEGVDVQRRFAIAPLLLVAALFVGACQADSDVPSDSNAPRIAASTALIAEFASIVAGDAAEVTALIPAGVDVHSYEPSPAIAAAIAGADLVFVNGYNLEEGLLDVVLENVSAGTEVVPASAGLTPLEGGHDDDEPENDHDHDSLIRAEGDPHFWLDVANANHYVEVIRDHLIELDAANRSGYEQRAAAYLDELRVLDDEVRAAVAAIPEAQRQLVVMHDAYQYLASAYDLELAAALLPAGAQQDPSAGAVVQLIELIDDLGVSAIYREPQFSASVLDTIADETGVRVLLLHSTYTVDIESYVDLMRANADALVDGLGR
jgi:ABC-type Zn uptake system ZnuABC Zn-binding protein ZnuA